jgi:hypothetical protein
MGVTEAKTPAERQAAYRKRQRRKAGEDAERRLNTWLPHKVMVALSRLALHHDVSQRAAPTQRDRHLRIIGERGRMTWQKASGYNLRAKVEASISRYKRVIGDALRSRTQETEVSEVAIAAAALNRILVLGRPNYVRID